METTRLIIYSLLVALNSFLLFFTITIVTRWLRRMESQLTHINKTVTVMYHNQLNTFIKQLIENEQFEEAAKLKEAIRIIETKLDSMFGKRK